MSNETIVALTERKCYRKLMAILEESLTEGSKVQMMMGVQIKQENYPKYIPRATIKMEIKAKI